MTSENTKSELCAPIAEEEKKRNRNRYNRRYNLNLIDLDEIRLFSTYADKTTLKDIWEWMEDKWLCLENGLEHGLHEEADREKIKSLIEELKATYSSKTRFAEWIRVKARAIEEDLAVNNNKEKAKHLLQLAEIVDKATD